MSFASKLFAVGAIASTALAHGTVPSLLIDGESKQGFLLDYYYAQQNGQEVPEHYGWYAENLDNGFVAPNAFGEPDIICHKNAKPASATTSVAAGGKVEFQWTAWPESHMGPVITYVANCGGDCATVDKTTLKFVKIDEAGYEDGQWAAVKMIANNNTWPVTVPETLAPGNYVFRHEIIALHGGGDLNGAQNYPQCFNIEITGSGTDNPEGVLGTELYTPEDAGIHFSPYQGTIDYPIPGPALYGSGSTAPPSGGNSTTPTPAPTPSSPAEEATPTAVDAEPSVAASATPAPTGSAGSELPETFTLETFIAWLQEKAGSSSAAKVRRHARAFRV